MNSTKKSFLFALVIVLTNWHWTKLVQRGNSSVELNIDGAGIWMVVCAAGLFFLILRLYRQMRVLLDRPDQLPRLPQGARLVSWDAMIPLLPLCFSWWTTSTIASEGAASKTTWGYGSPMGVVLFALAMVAMAIFQISEQLNRHYPNLNYAVLTPRY